jgi:hypothetical protein
VLSTVSQHERGRCGRAASVATSCCPTAAEHARCVVRRPEEDAIDERLEPRPHRIQDEQHREREDDGDEREPVTAPAFRRRLNRTTAPT